MAQEGQKYRAYHNGVPGDWQDVKPKPTEPTNQGKGYNEIVEEAAGGSQPAATNENASESGAESSTSGRYADHSSYEASNAGRQAQSTDHMNQY